MVAVAHETTLFDVQDFKVYKLTSDTGASPTYGTAVDVPGIAQVGLDMNLITAVLKGDAKTMARKGRVDSFKIAATYGKLSLDVLDVILEKSNTNIDSGTTPNQVADIEIAGTNKLPYFSCEFVILDVDEGIGDLHVRLWKAQITGGTLLPGQTEQFGQPTMEVEGIPAESDDKMIRIRLNETAVTL